MEIQPLQDRILVQRIERSETDPSGLFVPTATKDAPTEGIVVAVGPGHHQNGVFVETTLSVGDRVMFGKFTGDEVTRGNETYLIMSESQVLAVIGGA